MTTYDDETPEERRLRLARFKARYEAGENLIQPGDAIAERVHEGVLAYINAASNLPCASRPAPPRRTPSEIRLALYAFQERAFLSKAVSEGETSLFEALQLPAPTDDEPRLSIALAHWNQVQESAMQMMVMNERLERQCHQLKMLCLFLVVCLTAAFAWSWFTIHDLGAQADAILLREVTR